jgi:hypothetical protein
MTLEALPRPNVSSSEPVRATRTWSLVGRIAKGLAKTLALGGSVFLIAGSNCDEGVGDPCTPEQEYNSDFLGFDEKEVNVESKSFQCRTRLCLVNHFRGRVSCPYGQSAEGNPPADKTPACTIPGTEEKIVGAKDSTGAFVDPKVQSTVQPQCIDRAADKAVYCSCRCADINGDKPSDQTFCDCPDGFQCTRLVTSVGNKVAGSEGLTGSYCIKTGTQYEPGVSCSQGSCDPADKAHPCQ